MQISKNQLRKVAARLSDLLVVLNIGEGDLRPPILLISQREQGRRHKHWRAVEIGSHRTRIGVYEFPQLHAIGRRYPPAGLEARCLESYWKPIFRLQSFG